MNLKIAIPRNLGIEDSDSANPKIIHCGQVWGPGLEKNISQDLVLKKYFSGSGPFSCNLLGVFKYKNPKFPTKFQKFAPNTIFPGKKLLHFSTMIGTDTFDCKSQNSTYLK